MNDITDVEIGAFYNLSQYATAEELAHLGALVVEIEKTYQNKRLNDYRVTDVIYHCTVVYYACGRQMEEFFEQVLMKCSSFVDYPTNPEVFMTFSLENQPSPTHRAIHEALSSNGDITKLITMVEQHVISGAVAAGIEF